MKTGGESTIENGFIHRHKSSSPSPERISRLLEKKKIKKKGNK